MIVEPTVERRPIRRLDAGTVAQIAAGEVVERPASVVKELVENAVDAGASDVVVRIAGGGLDRIEVSDNGTGIPADELPLAVERHATSKLATPEDLPAVATLGFRGEALAAIGAVSRLRIVSRVPNEEAAEGIAVDGGSVGVPFGAGRAPGTTVEVRDLFFNTPARRKFLRAPSSEQLEVLATVERLYLARPEVGLALANEDREVARFPPATGIADAAGHVLGSAFLADSIPVEGSAGRGMRFEAVMGRPPLSRPGGQGLLLSVNGRSIQSRALTQALRVAYSEHLPKGRFPVGVLHLTIEPGQIDVNVHPTKREVRLSREREIADELRRAVRTAVEGAPHVAERVRAPLPLPAWSAVPRDEVMVPLDEAADVRTGIAFSAVGSAPVQQRLLPVGEPVRVAAGPRHPELKLVGSFLDLYWAAESEGSLVLVDQHAASERVVFDALLREGRLGRQQLVDPVRVALTPRQQQSLGTHARELASAGYEVEPFAPGEFRVFAVPSYRGHRALAESLGSLLDELADGGRPTVPAGGPERIAASIACHSAVRGGDRISATEMGRILDALYRLPDAAFACPHGRPILVRLKRSELDRWFLRSGP